MRWRLRLAETRSHSKPPLIHAPKTDQAPWNPVTMVNYFVYVIELEPRVLAHPKWKTQNPDQSTEQCFYVGQSAHEPECRFKQHTTQLNLYVDCFLCCCSCNRGKEVSSRVVGTARFVQDWAVQLRPDLYQHLNPLTSRRSALKEEAAMATHLKEQGHGAWFG